MRNNDQSNRIIKWIVTVGDFVVLNAILLGVNNIALMLAMLKFSTIIHLRVVGAGEILKRIIGLTVVGAILAYLLLKVFAYNLPIGWLIWEIGTVFFVGLLFKRLGERWFIKLYRQAGRNTRSVTLVGSDPELIGIYNKLKDDATYWATMATRRWATWLTMWRSRQSGSLAVSGICWRGWDPLRISWRGCSSLRVWCLVMNCIYVCQDVRRM